jgi:hypothetical protein
MADHINLIILDYDAASPSGVLVDSVDIARLGANGITVWRNVP